MAGFLKLEHFIEPINAETYKTIGAMPDEGRAVNPITVRPYLPAGEGEATSAAYLANLAAESMRPIMVYDLGPAIIEVWARHKLIGVARTSMLWPATCRWT